MHIFSTFVMGNACEQYHLIINNEMHFIVVVTVQQHVYFMFGMKNVGIIKSIRYVNFQFIQ